MPLCFFPKFFDMGECEFALGKRLRPFRGRHASSFPKNHQIQEGIAHETVAAMQAARSFPGNK